MIGVFIGLFCNNGIRSAGGAIAVTIDGNGKNRQRHKVFATGGCIESVELQSNAKDMGALTNEPL